MTKDMVQCPKDSKIMYQRDVCENIFRKGNMRCWCKTCELFKDEDQETESLQRKYQSILLEAISKKGLGFPQNKRGICDKMKMDGQHIGSCGFAGGRSY